MSFYRQESAIYEVKNSKLTSKLQKLKRKNSQLSEAKKLKEATTFADSGCQVEESELFDTEERDILTKKDKELAEAHRSIAQLEKQLASMTADTD